MTRTTAIAPATAATMVAAAADWLRTDQAAIMRQVAEQQSAYQWWIGGGRTHADATVTVPAWISHFYSETVTANPHPARLSPTATAIHQLLQIRAADLTAAPLHILDPDLTGVLVALAQSSYYREPDRMWPAGRVAGTVLLADPRPLQQHTTRPPIPGLTPVGDDAMAHLMGWTWFSRPGQVRVMDWISMQAGPTGIDVVDSTLAEHADTLALPPMINNGEWAHPTTELASTEVSRAKLTAATAEVAGTVDPDEHAVLVDSDALLVPRMAAVLADALAAGLFVATDHHIGDSRKTSRPVTVVSRN